MSHDKIARFPDLLTPPILTPEKVSIHIIMFRKLIVLFYKIQGKNSHTLISETAQFHPSFMTHLQQKQQIMCQPGTTVSLCFTKFPVHVWVSDYSRGYAV